MKKKMLLLVLVLLIGQWLYSQFTLEAGELRVGLSKQGTLTEIANLQSRKNYLSEDTLAPLLTVVREGNFYHPLSVKFNKKLNKIALQYAQGILVEIKVQEKKTHLVLEITKAEPASKIEAVIWGPYPTVISKTVGEVIGVVRDGSVAIGLQVLNIKTLGGNYPNNEGSTWKRGIAAEQRGWGSVIQAYSINRDRERLVDAWGGVYKRMPVAALKGESVQGSKIALFSCAEAHTLDLIEKIELAENLPHPTINGVWFKKSELFGKSYLISSFSEENIDEMIAYTKRAGLVSLYHEGPFKTWGHFVLNPSMFPNGRQGLKKCVEKAHAAGLRLGVHTLTNFITTNDPFVTPAPDDRLSAVGASTLLNDIDATSTEIEVLSPEYFGDLENHLHTVKIGKELIRYKTVTSTRPYRLLDCQRGAFGTTAASHKRGEVVSKLFDHSYKVFFPNLEMQRQMAGNLANLMSETGLDHLDFDGHEGGLATGQGDYAVDLFAKDVYEKVKHEFICGTSISKTFFWHIGSYYNWGEPWYGGFKESMQQYRIDNQALFDRNYMPHMLGWYLLAENTTLDEMEWMLARAAGYNAGFAMVANRNSLRKNPQTNILLDAIREWEAARNGNAFSLEQKERLKDSKNEFHLSKVAEGKWSLQQYSFSPVFKREKFERQPGEPVHSQWRFNQEWNDQALQFRIYVTGKEGKTGDIKITIDNYTEISIPVELSAGEAVICDGSTDLKVYSSNGRFKKAVKLAVVPPLMAKGVHSITMDCSFTGDHPLALEFQLKGIARSETCTISK